MRSSEVPRRVLSAVLCTMLLALAGCASFPRDPDGTLDSIRQSGVLEAGASHHPPFVQYGDPPTGSEVELIEQYADHLGVEVHWTLDTEAALVELLDRGDVHIIIAGLAESTPWADQVGLTRPYADKPDASGQAEPRVIAVPMGENALLVDLETWLDKQDST